MRTIAFELENRCPSCGAALHYKDSGFGGWDLYCLKCDNRCYGVRVIKVDGRQVGKRLTRRLTFTLSGPDKMLGKLADAALALGRAGGYDVSP